jgi:hypothetical protein
VLISGVAPADTSHATAHKSQTRTAKHSQAGQLDDAIDLYEQQVSELQQGLSENPDEREQASEALEVGAAGCGVLC